MEFGGLRPMILSTKVRFALRRRRHSTRRLLVVERLESRLALSTLPGADPLFILGTDGPDDIELTYDSALAQIRVTNADRLIGTFSLHEWRSVQIDAGNGDDRIQVDPSLPLPVNVIGGEGNDTLIGARLQSGQEVIFTSGEFLAFDNVSCVTVECVRAEGEGSTAGQVATTVFPPGLGMVDHSPDMPTNAFLSPGDLAGHSMPSAAVLGQGQDMQARIWTVGNEAHAEMRPLVDASSFSPSRHIPRRESNVPEESVEPARPMETESESVGPALPALPATGEMKDNIDAVISGWTEGAGSASSETSKSLPDSSANPKSTVEDVSATQIVFGASDVAATATQAAQRAPVAGNRNWIVAVAMAVVLVIGAAAFFLDRRAARLKTLTESRSDADI